MRPPDGIGVVAGNIGDRETGEARVGVAVDSIDVLVNHAGTFGLKSFIEVAGEDLDGYLGGNLEGTVIAGGPCALVTLRYREDEPMQTVEPSQ